MAKNWEDDSCDWRGLASSPMQVPRYKAIARTIDRFSSKGSILEVGCGEAVLRDYLSPGVKYFGIDPSAKATESARSRCGEDRIFHSTAEDFDAGKRRWDCIVFNEVLYYSSNPLGLLDKYAKLVRPEGIIVVSIYQKAGNPPIKSRLSHLLNPRRPMSNVHCTEMIHRFMARDGWLIDGVQSIAIPGGNEFWSIWAAKPQASQRQSI